MLVLVGGQERQFVGNAGPVIVGSLFISGVALAVGITTSMGCRCGKSTTVKVVFAF